MPNDAITVFEELQSIRDFQPIADTQRPQRSKLYLVTAATDQKQPEQSESTTIQQKRQDDIDQKVEALFAAAKEQVFEDGMESEFSRELISLIRKYGNTVLEVLSDLIVNEKVNAEVASEALRWLGRVDDPSSFRYRLWLLERSLRCSSARVRDGAILGLASLDDPHAITHLEQAIQQEKYAELREDMEQVLAQLESTR